LIPNPILKVLSTLSCHEVRHLLIGGQACVFYGAAEFSRDCDVVILADEDNFKNLNATLAELQAECIAIPEFKAEYLQRGHAVHFRCKHADVNGLRIDVMTQLRGCEPFERLGERRTTIQDPSANADAKAVNDDRSPREALHQYYLNQSRCGLRAQAFLKAAFYEMVLVEWDHGNQTIERILRTITYGR